MEAQDSGVAQLVGGDVANDLFSTVVANIDLPEVSEVCWVVFGISARAVAVCYDHF